MNADTIQIDKAGRVVLPKPLRQQFNLLPGDKLRLSVEGNTIRLEPAGQGGRLVREDGLLVFKGGYAKPVTTDEINEIIQQDREDRITLHAGKARRR